MQHLMIGDKSLLVGDDVAHLLLKYAALVGRTGRADTVYVNAWDGEGNETRAGVLLNGGTTMTTELSHSSLAAPDNGPAEARLQERLAAYAFNAGDPFSSGSPASDELLPE